MIEQYNTYMGGVDKADQLLSYYGFNHRAIKWWKRTLFHLLDLAIVNSYILYKLSSDPSRQPSHQQFRIQLAKELLNRTGIEINDAGNSHVMQTFSSLCCSSDRTPLSYKSRPSAMWNH